MQKKKMIALAKISFCQRKRMGLSRNKLLQKKEWLKQK